MRSQWIVALLLLSSLPSAILAEEKDIPEEYVNAVDASKWIADGETVLLAFATKNCPHCIKLGEQITEIRTALSEEGVEARFHKIDIRDETNSEFSNAHEINGVPTIYVYIKGEKMKYEGKRTPKAITTYVKKILSLSVSLLASKEEVEQRLKKNVPLALVVVENADSDISEVISLARSKLDVEFFYTTADVASALDFKHTLYFFRVDGISSLSSDEFAAKDSTALSQWIAMAALPSITSFPEDAQAMFTSGVGSILFVMESAEESGLVSKSTWLSVLAEELRGRLVIASLSKNDDSVAHIYEFFGVQRDNSALRIFNVTANKQYWIPADAELSEDVVKAWVAAFLNGEVVPHMKSEDVPDDWDQNAVKILVGKNFKEVAFDSKKDVFVMFHAPWCGHCKKLTPTWEQLAEKVTDLTDVIIAKIDATANDFDDGKGDVTSFPTLRFYKAGSNEVVLYKGERTLEALEEFVRARGQPSETKAESPESHDEL